MTRTSSARTQPHTKSPHPLQVLQDRLSVTQWRSADAHLAQQFIALRRLLRYALARVPYYQTAFADCAAARIARLAPDDFAALPILERSALQRAGAALRSVQVPPGHGTLKETQTSGSTGMPVRVQTTAVTRAFWQAFTLREHLWQQRDFSGKLVAIRTEGNALGPAGHTQHGWGPATDSCFATGPSALLGLHNSIADQADWLRAQNPDYLLTHPSNLRALADHCLRQGQSLPALRQVRSFGEVLSPAVRAACHAAWGVAVADLYSAQEVGYIALQCPEYTHYHVQSEGVYVEVLDAQGRACRPGEVGRVVVTSLHNYGTPLIRYALGDYAEVGEACGCGRGLPVLRRILGRTRNLLRLPDGRSYWPSFPEAEWLPLAPIRQWQLVQHDLHTLEARIVAAQPFTTQQEAALRDYLRRRFAHPFAVSLSYHDTLPGTGNGKFEDFVSLVDA